MLGFRVYSLGFIASMMCSIVNYWGDRAMIWDMRMRFVLDCQIVDYRVRV